MSESKRIATKEDWKSIKDFTPGKSTQLTNFSRKLTEEESNSALRGWIPEQMEDKWFVYWSTEEESLYFHRSWTGFLIYKVKGSKLPHGEKGLLLSEVEVNRDPQQYNGTSEHDDIATLNLLINHLIIVGPSKGL